MVSPDRKQQVSRLKQLVKDASEVYLATDEDREGEAIAWHLVDTLKPRVPVHRMVFHEITPEAIARAVANPRELDTALVDAQETRRILDRLYGYEVSPVLWKKVLPKLSAGRVQSVATRIVVERERERMAFHAADYWSLEGTFAVPRPGAATDEGEPTTVRAKLVSVDDSRVATGRDFDAATGRVTGDVVHLDEAGARGLAARLEGRQVTRQPGRREALPAPSVRAVHHLDAADGRRPQARLVLGADDAGGAAAVRERPHHLHAYRLDEPVAGGDQRRPAAGPRALRRRLRAGRGRAATRARPRARRRRTRRSGPPVTTSGRRGSSPPQLARDEFRLYELVWQRTVASQMADAVGQTVSIRLAGRSATDEAVEFTASGRTITFPGFLKAYVESRDEAPGRGRRRRAATTPSAGCRAWSAASSSTPASWTPRATPRRPPARYTEPSLVARLEELGIGRPSTYASIMQTIQDRGYVWKKGNSLVPSFIAFAVVNLLEQHFAQLVDYDFTASLEEELDEIADGNLQRVDWLTEFYFGGEGRHDRRHRRVRRPQADRRPAARGDRRPRRQLDPAAGHRAPTASRSSPGSAATAPTCRSTATTAPG